MLPSRVRLYGVVVDSAGEPLGDVRINHTGVRAETIRTDLHGRFDIETSAPAVVFRKDGFQSRYWRVSGDRELAVTLNAATSRAKECRAVSGCVSLKGFLSTFCLPRVPGVNISKQNNDVDYGQRWFWIRTPGGKAGIQHASGLHWGGLPIDYDVWSARDYAETAYVDREGFRVIDARGKGADGRCWRLVGHAFETASYRNVPEQDASLLDRVLDGLCVDAKRFKNRSEPVRPK